MTLPRRLKRAILQDQLPARLREISATVDDWAAPICAKVDLREAARLIEEQAREIQKRDDKIAKLNAKLEEMRNAQ